MINALLKKIFGTKNDREIKSLTKVVEEINALEPEYEKLSDDELKDKTRIFKERLANGETLDDILVEAFAVVRETSKRVLGLRHYDVQLIGGIVLHQGKITEMKTACPRRPPTGEPPTPTALPGGSPSSCWLSLSTSSGCSSGDSAEGRGRDQNRSPAQVLSRLKR